jgi:hypothetical protein
MNNETSDTAGCLADLAVQEVTPPSCPERETEPSASCPGLLREQHVHLQHAPEHAQILTEDRGEDRYLIAKPRAGMEGFRDLEASGHDDGL